MKPKHILILVLVMTAVGYALGRYVQPAKVVTKIEEIEVEKIKVEYRTIVRTIERPDGTREVEEITETIEESENERRNRNETIVDNFKPQWKAAALVGISSKDFRSSSAIYGIQVERRVLGPFFIGAWATTESNIGLNLSMEF